MQASGEPKLEAKDPAMLNRLKRIKYSLHAHNAVFVEVEVDEDLDTTNVSRVVNTVAAGRILNPKTARSHQLIIPAGWVPAQPLLGEGTGGRHIQSVEAGHPAKMVGGFLMGFVNDG